MRGPRRTPCPSVTGDRERRAESGVVILQIPGAPAMGVLDGRGQVVGIARLAESIPSKRGPVQFWRLEVRKVAVEGQWICRCREFVRLRDAAEGV